VFAFARTTQVITPLYQQAGSAVVFWMLFGLFAFGEGAMQLRSRLNRGGTRSEPWSQIIVSVTLVGGLLGGLAASSTGFGDLTAVSWPMFVVGIMFMAVGIAIRQWSIFTLGQFFTADVRVQVGQRVIDSGPYRWVRHPSYAGLIIFFTGVGLALTNAISLLILAVVPTVGLVVRIRFEERSLITELGEPYRQYAGTRKRLLPGVW
jgi:protein-S-isoprenylcysteine O-methyltransferase Ste14